jgi:hypothetical protein
MRIRHRRADKAKCDAAAFSSSNRRAGLTRFHCAPNFTEPHLRTRHLLLFAVDSPCWMFMFPTARGAPSRRH